MQHSFTYYYSLLFCKMDKRNDIVDTIVSIYMLSYYINSVKLYINYDCRFAPLRFNLETQARNKCAKMKEKKPSTFHSVMYICNEPSGWRTCTKTYLQKWKYITHFYVHFYHATPCIYSSHGDYKCKRKWGTSWRRAASCFRFTFRIPRLDLLMCDNYFKKQAIP